ncbi:uncharacterized protein LOC121813196, partial [Haplochromis burtoni]|uniref:uncharacterized protein LOC121813196 n=1 Tax=Haplochromis burtoni TaxID=8153 RepID=UPI001C2D90A8
MSAGTASLCYYFQFFSVFVFVSADQKNITAESGQDVTLTCRAPNNNTKFVHWSKGHLTSGYVYLYQEGQFVPQGQHPSFKNRVDLQDRQMKDGDVSLILKDVTINDTGTYECRVFMKETRSQELIIIIHLHVDSPGQPGGDKQDGGKDEEVKKEEGKKDEGKKEEGNNKEGKKEEVKKEEGKNDERKKPEVKTENGRKGEQCVEYFLSGSPRFEFLGWELSCVYLFCLPHGSAVVGVSWGPVRVSVIVK